MKPSEFERLYRTRMTRKMLICLGAVALFYAVVCTAVFVWIASDVLLQTSALQLIWELVMTVCNYLFYWIGFSFLLYGWVRFGLRESMPLTATYATVSVVRYFANHLVSALIVGGQSINDFFSESLWYILLDGFADCIWGALLLAVFVAVTKTTLQNADEKVRLQFLKAGIAAPLNSLSSSMRKLMLCAAIFPGAVQILARIYYDLSYGAPRHILDVLYIVFYYLSDVLFILAGYVVLTLVINKLFLFEQKSKREYHE